MKKNINFDLLFPDKRESSTSSHRQAQLVILRMLKIFHYLCEINEIKYFLICGSAIGAVRHQGFIPWDDDIDVGMTRENYRMFVEKCVPDLPDDIFFQNTKTDTHYPAFDYVDAKLRDKYSSYRHKNENTIKYHDGLQLDLFVFDFAFFPNKLFIIFENIIINNLSKTPESREKKLEYIKKIFSPCLVYSNNWLHKIGMLKLNIGPIYIKKNEIDRVIKVKFEDTEVYVNYDFDKILRRQYGDYMKLPPLEKRVPPHNVIFRPFMPCNHSEILYWDRRNK